MILPYSYYNSKKSAAFLLPLPLLMATMCGCMLYFLLRRLENYQYWLTWVFSVFFSLSLAFSLWAIVVLIRRLVSDNARLTLTESGVIDYTSRIGEIAWSDIENAYVRYTKGGALICLNLRNTNEYVARLSAISRLLIQLNPAGFTPIALSLIGVKANADDVLFNVKSLAAQNH